MSLLIQPDNFKITSSGQIHGAIVVTDNSTVGAATLSAASLVGGVITRSGSVASYTDTTDTATAIIAAIEGASIGTSFRLRIVNTVAFTETIAAGTGVTLSGTMTIPGTTYRDFVGIITSIVSPAVTLTSTGQGSVNNLWQAGSANLSIRQINSAAPNTASGIGAVALGTNSQATGLFSLCMGNSTQATGINAFAKGINTIASGNESEAGGALSEASRYGEWAHGSHSYGQYGTISYGGNTPSNSPQELAISNAADKFTIPAGQAYRVKLYAIAYVPATGAVQEWEGNVSIIKNLSGTTSLVAAITMTAGVTDGTWGAAAIAVTADDTNDTLKVVVTGIASTSIDWSVKCEYLMVK